jgi:hypothetical protein
LRFLDPNNRERAWSEETERYWMPVDLYVGGVEHAVLHLLYARFWHKVLFDCGLVHTKEPFQRLFNQGMVLAYSHRDDRGKYYAPQEVEERDGIVVAKATGVPLSAQIEKMSKSKLNVVSPDEVIGDYGADAMRLYELFMGPLEQVKPWQMSGVEGVYRFLHGPESLELGLHAVDARWQRRHAVAALLVGHAHLGPPDQAGTADCDGDARQQRPIVGGGLAVERARELLPGGRCGGEVQYQRRDGQQADGDPATHECLLSKQRVMDASDISRIRWDRAAASSGGQVRSRVRRHLSHRSGSRPRAQDAAPPSVPPPRTGRRR